MCALSSFTHVLGRPSPQGDPCYDSEDENVILVSGDAESYSRSPGRHNYDPEQRRLVIGPMLTLSEFKRRVTVVLEEYYVSEDAEEALRTISEVGLVSGFR